LSLFLFSPPLQTLQKQPLIDTWLFTVQPRVALRRPFVVTHMYYTTIYTFFRLHWNEPYIIYIYIYIYICIYMYVCMYVCMCE
jgi:hypothetical protein